MLYISCDVETTGTDGMKHDLLEVAMAAFDSETAPEPLGIFTTIVKKDHRLWEDATLQFHIKTGKLGYFLDSPGMAEAYVASAMSRWVTEYNAKLPEPWFVPSKRIWPTVCGKNFAGFDGLFLKRLPGWETLFDFRVLDLGNLVVQVKDKKIPNLKGSLERVGMQDEIPHTALEDAVLTGKAVWHALNGTMA